MEDDGGGDDDEDERNDGDVVWMLILMLRGDNDRGLSLTRSVQCKHDRSLLI